MKVFKKTVSLLMAVLILLMFVPQAFATGEATIYADEINATAGESVTVPIMISDNPGFTAIGLNITYDVNALTPVSAEKGSVISSGMTDNSIVVNDNGEFNVIWMNSKETTKNGVLFNLTFNVKTTAPSQTSIGITVDEENTFNKSYQVPVFNIQDLVLNITGSSGENPSQPSETNPTEIEGNLKFYSYGAFCRNGETKDISVKVSGNPGLLGFKLEISYDPESVEIDDVFESELTENGQFNFSDKGNKIIVLWSSSDEFSENGVIFTISAKALKVGKANFGVSYSYNDTFDEDYNSLEATCESFDLDVYLFGDVNLDGKCNINDVTYIQMYLVCLIEPSEVSMGFMDVTGDGKESIRDATYIQMVLAGLIQL